MIGTAIYTLLTTNPALSALTANRVTASIIPQDQAVPCVYYGTDRIRPLPVRDSMGCSSGTLEVGFQTATYAELDTMTRLVRAVLDNYQGIVGGFSVRINPATTTPDDYDDKLRLHTRALEFSAFIQHKTI